MISVSGLWEELGGVVGVGVGCLSSVTMVSNEVFSGSAEPLLHLALQPL